MSTKKTRTQKPSILYLASSADWHVDSWSGYFANRYPCFLFSDNEARLVDQPYNSVKKYKSNGIIGRIINHSGANNHKTCQLNKLASTRVFSKEIENIIKKHSINIIHAHSLFYGYLASYIPKSTCPVIFTPMGSDIIIHAQRNPIYRFMAKKAFARADIVTNDSMIQQSKGYLVGARSENNYIIQNGVDQNIFYPRNNTLREKYHVKEGETLLFSPRAITPLYNIDTIITSLHHLRQRGIKFKCMFSYCFGGGFFDHLNRMVTDYGLEDQVVWLGSLSSDEMAEHYSAADIVISVPSSDSSPRSVYESFFCGTPVILSDLPWSGEFLIENECVIRVQPKNSLHIADAVVKLIHDKNFLERLVENARFIGNKYFDYYSNMAEMDRLILEALP